MCYGGGTDGPFNKGLLHTQSIEKPAHPNEESAERIEDPRRDASRAQHGHHGVVGDPGNVNLDPEGASWFFKVRLKDKSEFDELMSKADYEKFVAENPS
mgnify:CR=1 FL=1